jgi:hypothetical protein
MGLPQLLSQPPVWPPLPGGQDPSKVYATIKSEVARPPDFDTSGSCWDYRKVTITLYGLKDNVTTALIAVLGVFNAKTQLTYPSGASFLRWKPLDRGNLVPDVKTKQGQQIFQGVLTAEVWSERSL